MQLLLPHTRGLLLSRPRAFREDASSVLTGVSPRRQPAPTATDTTLWKKPSFPFVALIALTTLPFDLAAARQSGAPPRHAKPTTAGTARPTPTQDIAAAAGQGNSSAASSAVAAAAGAGAGSAVDSWDAAGGDVSDEDAEQQAKAMVIKLLTHPKDTEAALMWAAAAGEGGGDGGAAEGTRLSVSPEYIDALVQAAREPTMGMPHHKQPPPAAKEDTKSRPAGTRPWSSSSSSNSSSQEEF